ncbi:hypothetical protein [Thermococcus barossii]|uniref:Uncharacterized protein n=1 Tax=Thermococcus barossii TaxID=54077 RepID=A0A2Z2MFH2_9EURY|nr:hypothetical protein [Thermococcus barossii]ASJ04666.1 hypothetical protein A3L01_04520 [Thermococcus barossii]
MNNILMKVYYTPANVKDDPDRVNIIVVTDEDDKEKIDNRIRRYCAQKKKPLVYKYDETGISEYPPLAKIKDFPNQLLKSSLKEKDEIKVVKDMFETLRKFLYTSAKHQTRYLGMIITEEYVFLYHYIPKPAVTFEGDSIKEFIKYFDESTINWFIFYTTGSNITSLISNNTKGNSYFEFNDSDNVIYAHAKQGNSGLSVIIDRDIEYEQNGEVLFRVGYKPNTDIVLDTSADAIEDELFNNNNPIVVNLDNGIVTIEGFSAPLTIKEVKVGTDTYTKEHFEVAKHHITYKRLHIEEIFERIKFYLKKLDPIEIIDTPGGLKFIYEAKVSQKDREPKKYEMKKSAIISYPRDTKLKPGKTLYYIFPGRRKKSNYTELVQTISNDLSAHCNVDIVEISSFKHTYQLLEIGRISLFVRIKDEESKLAKRIATHINRIVSSLDQNKTPSNLLYKRLLSIIGLIEISRLLVSAKLKEILSLSAKQAIAQILKNEYGSGPSMAIRELDKLGVDLKAGIRRDNQKGLFDSSPSKFAEKIKEKMKRREDIVVYLIGINEDTKDFSPVPLNKVRDEFITSAKEKIEEDSTWRVIELTPIPLNEREGVLLLIAMRQQGQVSPDERQYHH